MTQVHLPNSAPDPTAPVAPPGLNVQRRLILAWLALSWERIWTRLWIVAALLGLFGIVLLTDVLPSLHWILHTGVVVASAAVVGFTLWHRLRGFAWPSRSEARARLETTSPVEHRPLTAVEDSLVAGATATQQWMWRIHQDRARDDLDRLRVKAPAPDVASRDRFALRAAVVLALFVAVVGGWGDMSDRIWRGVLPMLGGDSSRAAVKLWITPPTYTNLSPIYLETPVPAGSTPITTLDIPAGSTALAIVTGTGRDTALQLDEAAMPFLKLADETQQLETALKPAKRLEVRQGSRVLAGWDVRWLADQRPVVAILSPPSEGVRWRTRIDYMVRDDYGANTVTARVTRSSDATTPPLEFPVSLPPAPGSTFAHSSTHDLASHIWAGQNVVVQLIVTDHAGQVGESETMEAKLPERVFTHPVSKELARWRRGIATRPAENVPPALASVTRILQRPELFGGEPLVHLTLTTAKYRMTNESAQEASRTIPELLWHAAVRIEDGNLVNAEQRLVEAEKALRDAIARGAPPEEINRRLAELREAVAEYSKALAEKDPDGKNGFTKNNKMKQDAIKASMDELKKLSEMGAEDAAKEALANLEEQLQALRDGNQDQGDDSPEAKRAQELMQKMEEMAEEQSNLLNDSFEKARKEEAKENGEKSDEPRHGEGMEGGPGNPDQKKKGGEKTQAANGASAQSAASKQEALRKKLNEMMDNLEEMTGKTPESMEDADKSMADARDALRSGQWKQGAEGQAQASNKLQKGIEQAQEQLLQALLDKGLGGALERPQAGVVRFSPLGGRDGRRGGQKVTIPTGPDTEGMAERVRVILDEIRRRAADRTRSESEQDYLRRLKKQF